MKKFLIIVFVLLLCLSAACANKASETPNPAPVTVAPEAAAPPADSPVDIESATGAEDSTAAPETTEAKAPVQAGAMAIEAADARAYNTADNPVPLGQWVSIISKNYESGEFEPYYIRVVGVSRDQAAVQAALDGYDGIFDLSLSADEARDIEWGVLEYEIYFAPDYAAADWGISINPTSFRAETIEGGSFKTDGGMTYIGVGSAYDLRANGFDNAAPGDTVSQKSLFSILKDYDESEYVFSCSWYDGEIVTENARETFFAGL